MCGLRPLGVLVHLMAFAGMFCCRPDRGGARASCGYRRACVNCVAENRDVEAGRWARDLEHAMSDNTGKGGGAGGFLPGLVLGVIVGAVTAFVALEVLDSNKISIEPGTGTPSGERVEQAEGGEDGKTIEELAQEALDNAADGAEEVGEQIGDAVEEAGDETKKLLDPPADPGND